MRPARSHSSCRNGKRISIRTLSSSVIPMKRDPPGGGVSFFPSYSPIHLYDSRKFDMLHGQYLQFYSIITFILWKLFLVISLMATQQHNPSGILIDVKPKIRRKQPNGTDSLCCLHYGTMTVQAYGMRRLFDNTKHFR